ncbi:hypothetical protein ACWGB8_18615 [Kitasatospora sp. NPDC054939]
MASEWQSAGRGPVRWLFRTMVADPGRLPEILAAFAYREMGPRADAAVARLRKEHPEAGPEELWGLVVEHGRRRVELEGAFVGGPLMVLMPVAFCAALLAQLRMVLELAVVAGRDAAEPERAAELLVVQGAHPDLPAARAALAHLDENPAVLRKRTPKKGFWAVIKRMAFLLGLVTTSARPVSRLVHVGRWALVAVVLVAGFFAPLVWLPYLGWSYHRSTNELAAHTIAYYRLGTAPPPGRIRLSADPGMLAAFLKAILSLLVVLATIFVFLVGLRNTWDGASGWFTFGGVLIATSTFVGAAWYVYQRRRRRRERARRAAGPEA